MKASQKLIDYIKQHEGFRGTAYFDDYAGTPDIVEYSIGYGHQIQPGEEYLKTSTITPAQAETLMKKDLAIWENYLNNKLVVSISQSQFDALLNLCYAIGGGNASKIINLINGKANKNDIIAAWQNIGTYWQGTQRPGLVEMRKKEIEMFYGIKPGMVIGLLIAGILIFVGLLMIKK